MKEKKIQFYPYDATTQYTIDYPEPASKFIPEWYRKMNTKIHPDHGPTNMVVTNYFHNGTIKACMPFFDAMTSGYIVTLPSDVVFVDEEQHGNRVVWQVSYNLIGGHPAEQFSGMPISSDDGSNAIFKWIFYFTIKTPPGYSCLFTHPTFAYDSPFKTMTGIVDTDTHPVAVNFPFILKKDFMGKIEKGTPICQIIPFKRDSWKMVKEEFDPKTPAMMDNIRSVVEKSYRNRFWSRKSYK